MPLQPSLQKKVGLLFFLLFACAITQAQPDIQKKFQREFVMVKDGGTITLPEGIFHLDVTLWMDAKKNITIRGAGKDKTFLNFSNQVSGAEGIKVSNGENIRITDLTVQDTKGDGIKTQQVNGITFYNVRAEWTQGSNEKNGGYGIYPVQCENVLIDSCEARGASDAGIYVGQSKNIIVRNCKATENVAGIEIENSHFADVLGNEVTNNTGGILVFDLPDLMLKNGHGVRVYNNNIHENNHLNFAPKGNIVGKVPQGTGVMVMGTRDVEIFNNKIINNITVGTVIVSYYISENPIKDSLYDPYPNRIYIHDNYYTREHTKATSKGRMGQLYKYKLRFGKNVPHIVWDGIRKEEWKQSGKGPELCIKNNINATFCDIKADNKFRNKSKDMTPFDCTQAKLPGVTIVNR